MKTISKIFILIVAVLLIFQSLFVVFKTYETVGAIEKEMIKPTAKASGSGIVNLCINTEPSINISDCSPNATQEIYYECWLNASDLNNNNFTYSSVFTVIDRAFNNSNASFFTVMPDGFVGFTPTNNDVGNFTIQFTVNDGIGCNNSEDSEYFNLTVFNVNDPPVFLQNIPDQAFSEAGEVIHAFYLDNHFTDPDLDALTYSFVTTNNYFTISIDNVTSEVVITATVCDVTTYARFIATDPYAESNSSNLVALKCVSDEPGGDGEGGEGEGSGGGAASAGPCIPEYECYDYHKCNRSNVKIQRCVDIHGCEPDVYLTVPCIYDEELECNETWNCSDWEPCLPNSTQYRTCVDLNECGTKEFMPALIQECEYIGTCEDGIKNCHNGSCEEGIDCGGPCLPCKAIEVPYPFIEEKGILIYILTGIVLLLLTLILMYHYFRKEINAAIAKAGWIITKRKRKQVLLSLDDKKKLLIKISELEKELGTIPLFETLNKYSKLLRYYLINVCGKKLSPEFDLEELKKVLDKNKRNIREVLRKIFVFSFSKYLKVEQNKDLITETNLTLLIEELRNLVLQTSKVEPEDIARKEKEFKMPEQVKPMDKMVVLITNTYIALEFLELDVAKKKYLQILEEYEKLDLAEQEEVYEDLARLYNNISYVNSWHGKVKE
ncbi:hypothetical protein KY348_05175 [Candidatus Woesearchaeota archaeon]|nr:hypothetical protein [Candidatus Woesearchaeota archaeon]